MKLSWKHIAMIQMFSENPTSIVQGLNTPITIFAFDVSFLITS